MFLACEVFIFSSDVFICLWVVYVRRRHYGFFFFFFLVSHVLHWLLIYITRLFMICLLFYVFVKSRSYFVLLVFSTHAFMCLLSVLGIYRLIQSCCCLHQQQIDGSQVELFLGHFIVIGWFVTLSIFVLVCVLSRIAKMGVCLVLRNQELMYQNFLMYMLANHDKNIQSRFKLLKVCLCVKLESSVLQDLMCKSAKLD